MAANGSDTTYNFQGKVFIVTGSSGGIGRATALMLSEAGAKVGLLDVKEPHATAEEITKRGGQAVAVACDVRKSNSVKEAVEKVANELGPLDGAANLAGVLGAGRKLGTTEGSLAETSDEEWDRVISINLTGVKNCMQAEIAHMNKAGGSIVNAGSVAGQAGTPYNSPYAASKAGVISLTQSVAKETGKAGIRINALAPGVVDTPMVNGLASREALQPWYSNNALGRAAQPEEIGQLIMWLLSHQSSYCTGGIYNIDAGR